MVATLVGAGLVYKKPNPWASGAPRNGVIAAISDPEDKVLDLHSDCFHSERFEFMPRKAHV
jgi:hypothetical protein